MRRGETLSLVGGSAGLEAVRINCRSAEIPAEFPATGSESCGVVVFWTRRSLVPSSP